jgi:hypothetical protein
MKINLNEGYYFMDNLSHIGKLTKPNNPKNKGDIYWLMKQKDTKWDLPTGNNNTLR